MDVCIFIEEIIKFAPSQPFKSDFILLKKQIKPTNQINPFRCCEIL